MNYKLLINFVTITLHYTCTPYSSVHVLAEQDPKNSDQPVTMETNCTYSSVLSKNSHTYLITTLTNCKEKVYMYVRKYHSF